jgi:hypothetical protein
MPRPWLRTPSAWTPPRHLGTQSPRPACISAEIAAALARHHFGMANHRDRRAFVAPAVAGIGRAARPGARYACARRGERDGVVRRGAARRCRAPRRRRARRYVRRDCRAISVAADARSEVVGLDDPHCVQYASMPLCLPETVVGERRDNGGGGGPRPARRRTRAPACRIAGRRARCRDRAPACRPTAVTWRGSPEWLAQSSAVCAVE